MKTLAVTLLATVAMIGAAQADDMDVYGGGIDRRAEQQGHL